MRQLGRCPKQKVPCSGQALLELAIFGSLLLFILGVFLQYGMSLNYKDYQDMATFRRALSLAVNRSQAGAEPNVSLLVISDKSIPSPADPYGIKEHEPYVSSAMAVFSDKLYSEPTSYKSDALPGVDIVINEQWLTTREMPDGEIGRYAGGAENRRPGFVTGGWRRLVNPCAQTPAPVFRKKSKKPIGIIWWQWEDVACKDVKAGQKVDIDNDFIEETVVEIVEEIVKIGVVEEYWFILDPKLGDINPEYGEPNASKQAIVPYKKTLEDGTEAIVSQGLQSGYTKKSYIPEYKHNQDTDRWEGTYIERRESESGITTVEGVDSKETITRKIFLQRKGGLTPPENQIIERPVQSEKTQQSTKVSFTPF